MSASQRRDLFLATFAILALELAIIRWMSQQVRLFAYLNNVLLIAARCSDDQLRHRPAGLLELPMAIRGIAGSLVNALPIGFAGLAFPTLRLSPQPDAALVSDLLGAVLGGCLEYVSMVVGLRALTLLALALYLGAFLIIERRRAGIAPIGRNGGVKMQNSEFRMKNSEMVSLNS